MDQQQDGPAAGLGVGHRVPVGAPLGWQIDDPTPVADAVGFLLSDRSRGVSGEILHVDGGFHAVGC